MSHKVLLSFFDHSGNQSRPYRENGWRVIQVDIKHGYDLLDFNIIKIVQDNEYAEFGIIAPMMCTAYALSGNKHKKTEARKAIFEYSQLLMVKLKSIIDFLSDSRLLLFWMLENPMSDIHTHNKWLGKPRQKFNPCDFAGYLNPTDNDLAVLKMMRGNNKTEKLDKWDYAFIDKINAYNKKTWLWGNFRPMTSKRIEPVNNENPGWKLYGGKSERTKELRSITPMGFAWAFYEANH